MIDLRSDTVTRPSAAMREAMAAAEVGDDVYYEDPTVNALQEYAAALFGKAAALFLPSGTMANLVAFLAQTRPGDAVILSAESHPYHYEGGNMALVGGLLAWPLAGDCGKLAVEDVRANLVQIPDHHFAQTTLVSIENTTNRGGGACYSLEEVAALGALCREREVRLHCDGARLFNAVVATGTSPSAYAAHCDTVSFCLSKGLGAPAGSLLVGDWETIHRAHRYRKLLGGGMRQAGILAAAGLHALTHHVEDLREDHRRAREFRSALESRECSFPMNTPTNIVYFSVREPDRFIAAAEREGVLLLWAEKYIRAVFHRDITDNDLARAVEVLRRLL
ncbi:MAG: low-specificity L-threonine aldolase [Candidatus Hydrogenedentes bacterium]|nr:low-specificity L-threonine aldolase [Candidatus Hydrogenedentota bacterium]